jgi:hypothetical protein
MQTAHRVAFACVDSSFGLGVSSFGSIFVISTARLWLAEYHWLHSLGSEARLVRGMRYVLVMGV